MCQAKVLGAVIRCGPKRENEAGMQTGHELEKLGLVGTPEGIRTPDLLLRSSISDNSEDQRE